MNIRRNFFLRNLNGWQRIFVVLAVVHLIAIVSYGLYVVPKNLGEVNFYIAMPFINDLIKSDLTHDEQAVLKGQFLRLVQFQTFKECAWMYFIPVIALYALGCAVAWIRAGFLSQKIEEKA